MLDPLINWWCNVLIYWVSNSSPIRLAVMLLALGLLGVQPEQLVRLVGIL